MTIIKHQKLICNITRLTHGTERVEPSADSQAILQALKQKPELPFFNYVIAKEQHQDGGRVKGPVLGGKLSRWATDRSIYRC
jgi:hypothetical protein